MKKYNRGYTAGVFDMFHIGHLNILKNAKKMCKFLIVGVSTDKVVKENKNKIPIIPFNERIQIVNSIKYVDSVLPQDGYDEDYKVKLAKELKIDVMFVGSDWKDTPKWNQLEKRLKEIGCDVVYLEHTDGISSTILRSKITEK